MVNIRYHHCAYASRASMAQRDNRSEEARRLFFGFLVIYEKTGQNRDRQTGQNRNFFKTGQNRNFLKKIYDTPDGHLKHKLMTRDQVLSYS